LRAPLHAAERGLDDTLLAWLVCQARLGLFGRLALRGSRLRRAERKRKNKRKRGQYDDAAAADRTVKCDHAVSQYARKTTRHDGASPNAAPRQGPRARKMGSTPQT
jgi:hypothetical protein